MYLKRFKEELQYCPVKNLEECAHVYITDINYVYERYKPILDIINHANTWLDVYDIISEVKNEKCLELINNVLNSLHVKFVKIEDHLQVCILNEEIYEYPKHKETFLGKLTDIHATVKDLLDSVGTFHINPGWLLKSKEAFNEAFVFCYQAVNEEHRVLYFN